MRKTGALSAGRVVKLIAKQLNASRNVVRANLSRIYHKKDIKDVIADVVMGSSR